MSSCLPICRVISSLRSSLKGSVEISTLNMLRLTIPILSVELFPVRMCAPYFQGSPKIVVVQLDKGFPGSRVIVEYFPVDIIV